MSDDRTHPFAREWAVEGVGIEKYPIITGNWTFTRTKIAEVRAALAARSVPGLRCVAAAGSTGRMESGPMSDGDFIVLVEDGLDETRANEVHAEVWKLLEPLGIERPKADGVFATPATSGRLIGPKAGSGGEARADISKRLLLLLETQPLFGDEAFEETIDALLGFYARDFAARDPSKEWTFLLNDLVRYFRTVCLHYQWEVGTDRTKWRIRNLKLRHSRVVMYAGLLLLLGECSKERADKVTWLRHKLRLTPLERIACVYAANSDWSFHRIAGPYDFFLGRFNDPDLRKLLVDEERVHSYAERYQLRPYAELKATSDALAAELTRFILARRGAWTERFFEYLLI